MDKNENENENENGVWMKIKDNNGEDK